MSSSPAASQSNVSLPELKDQLTLDSCRALLSVVETVSRALTWSLVSVRPLLTPEMATDCTDAVTRLVVSTSYRLMLPVAVRAASVSVRRAELMVVSRVPVWLASVGS